MTVFHKAIADIFNAEDFTETCFIENDLYKCIVTAVDDGVIFTDDSGMASDITFALSIKLPISRMPQTGDKVRYNGKEYRISSTVIDSASASIRINLCSLSKWQ